jgi:hypothetical protein
MAKKQSKFIEDLLFNDEASILTNILIGQKKAGESIRQNAIVESYNNKGELQTFATKIEIGSMKEFDLPTKGIGITREHMKERVINICHPVNIERITFIVNDKTVEFVRCQD